MIQQKKSASPFERVPRSPDSTFSYGILPKVICSFSKRSLRDRNSRPRAQLSYLIGTFKFITELYVVLDHYDGLSNSLSRAVTQLTEKN